MKKILLSIVMVSFLTACATDPYTGERKVSKTAWGTGIGTALGAGVGALIGGEKGALIGAGIGAGVGVASGGYMDIQASKLQGTGVQVARDGENIRLIMPNAITFNTNEAIIKFTANPVLDSVAKVAKEYNKTNLQVIGYTDSTGNDAINIPLSQRRAAAVMEYLALRGVNQARINALGLGAQNPIASNETSAGREQNRRVEIYLINQQ